MGMRFRKSINLGAGFKINLSKSGVGYSWGVPGYRITKTANGRTRRTASIPGTGISHVTENSSKNKTNKNIRNAPEADDDIFEIESSDISQLQPIEYKEITDKISSSIKINKLSNIFLWVTLAAIINPLFLISGVLGVAIKIIARRLCTVNLSYKFDDNTLDIYNNTINTWMSLNNCQTIWQTTAKQNVSNAKVNAGASQNIFRFPIRFFTKTPYFISTNANMIWIKLKNEQLYLLPDKILVIKGAKVGVTDYSNVSINTGTTRFIEQVAPKDAEVLEYTWQYVNKNGNPDKRYKGNRQLPVCLYGTISLNSPGCLDIELMCSNVHVVSNFESMSRRKEEPIELHSKKADKPQIKENPPMPNKQKKSHNPDDYLPKYDPKAVINLNINTNEIVGKTDTTVSPVSTQTIKQEDVNAHGFCGRKTLIKYEFLKKLNGTTIDRINETMRGFDDETCKYYYNKCIKNGLICISKGYEALNILTIAELKPILKSNGLKVSGKKAELIARIKENVQEETLNLNPIIVRSAQGNIEYNRILSEKENSFNALYDSIVEFLSIGDFAGAKKTMNEYEKNQPYHRGINIDFYNNTIDKPTLSAYKKIFSQYKNKTIPAICICNKWLGLSYAMQKNKAQRYINRLSANDLDAELIMYESKCIDSLLDIEYYKNSNLSKYQISSALDENTCPKCRKMTDKVFSTENAKIGVNLPPFCPNCRCTTIPYFDDEF